MLLQFGSIAAPSSRLGVRSFGQFSDQLTQGRVIRIQIIVYTFDQGTANDNTVSGRSNSPGHYSVADAKAHINRNVGK